MFYLFNIAGAGILDFSEKFFSDNKLEDAHFSTYMSIDDEEIAWLEKEYDLQLEAQRYINLTNDETTARVFERTEEIDLYEITGGSDVSNDDEVIISEGYAENMGIAVGDKIHVGEKEYTVSGYFQRPDYLYMLQNADDFYKNITTFFLCYLSDSEFESLGNVNCQYLVKYNQDNSREFREYIQEEYVLQDYLAAEENQRICMVDDQAYMFLIMSYALLVVLPLIAVALVSIIISRKVKSEQKMIGTLTALGYTKGQLMRHYAGFAAIPGILGGGLSAIVSLICDQSFGEMGFAIYMMVGLGVIICISAIYVAVNMLVTESRGNISMLKVLGYEDKKINQIVLRINHILLPIGIAVSIPAVLASGNAVFKIYADTEGMLMTMDIAGKSYVITILLTLVSYFGSLMMIQRKVKRVSMVECLKDNRE